MRKILLFSLALLPLLSTSAFSAQTDDAGEKPVPVPAAVEKEDKADPAKLQTSGKQSSPHALQTSLGPVNRDEYAKQLKVPATWDESSQGIVFHIPLLPLLLKPSLSNGMNFPIFTHTLNTNPADLVEQNGSIPSQFMRAVKYNTADPEALSLTKPLGTFPIERFIKVLDIVSDELSTMLGTSAASRIVLDTLLEIQMIIDPKGMGRVEMTKATKMLLREFARINGSLETHEKEQEAVDAKIWSIVEKPVKPQDQEALKADIYTLKETLEAKAALEKEFNEWKQSAETEMAFLLKEKEAAEHVYQEQEKQKVELAEYKAQMEKIVAAKGDLEKAASGFNPATAAAAQFKSATEPFLTEVTSKLNQLDQNLATTYNALLTEAATLSATNTAAIKKQRPPFVAKIKEAVSATGRELQKMADELKAKVAELEKTAPASASQFSSEKQEKLEDLQRKREGYEAKVNEFTGALAQLKLKLGESYPQVKATALMIQKQAKAKSETEVIVELKVGEKLREMVNSAIAEIEATKIQETGAAATTKEGSAAAQSPVVDDTTEKAVAAPAA